MSRRWVLASSRRTGCEATQLDVRAAIVGAGEAGLDIAELDDRAARRARRRFDDVAIVAGQGATGRRLTIRSATTHSLAALLAGGVTPARTARRSTRPTLRELLRRKLIVERDGVYFHPDTIDARRRGAAARLVNAESGRVHRCSVARRDRASSASTRCRWRTSSTPAASLGGAAIFGWRVRGFLPTAKRRHPPEPALLGVIETSFEIARRLGNAHVVGDHLAELLRVGEQPAVRALDNGALDAGGNAQRLERLTRDDAVACPPQDA